MNKKKRKTNIRKDYIYTNKKNAQAENQGKFEVAKKKTAKKRRKRRIILFIIEVIVILILLAGVFLMSKFNKMNIVELNKGNIVNELLDKETKEKLESYTDIALFGLDNRETGNYSWGNSDLIMIASINDQTGELSMVSVYRDTYLDISKKGESSKFRKANSAYNNGGAEQSLFMLNNNLDLNIDDYVAFDFEAVADAIDVLGGIEVDLTDAEVKYINTYITQTNEIVGGNSNTIWSAGPQTLDGVQAVAYSRIRYTAGGDFKRAERQRIVIEAALKKAKTCDLKTLNELVDVVFPKIETSMSAANMLQLVGAVYDMDVADSEGFPFERSAIDHPSRGDIVVPCTLETNVIELHRILYGTENYVPSQTVQNFSDYIENDTGYGADDGMDDKFTLDYQEE